MKNVDKVIDKFIDIMGYLNNDHVLGVFFYGSYLTGYNDDYSDIDLHVIFDNSDSGHLIRGNCYINGIRIEYFEKPINDVYMSVNNDFSNQSNVMLSIVGTSKIIFDRTGELDKLQKFTIEKFSKPLPPMEEDDAREYVSILNNRMDKINKAYLEDSPNFIHLYHLTLEKLRKFYHRLKGIPSINTSKVFRVYTDEGYRNSISDLSVPDDDFILMYLDAVCDSSLDKSIMYSKLIKLFDYVKQDVNLNEKNYRIHIKSRNVISGDSNR